MSRLTSQTLKRMKFTTQFHLNGGSDHSYIQRLNEKWEIHWSTATDGSPNYKITANVLSSPGVDAEVDLTASPEDRKSQMTAFVREYNRVKSPEPKP